MGEVLQFPPERSRQGYDPNGIRYLQLDPPRPSQVTILGECAISSEEQLALIRFLQGNSALWSVRLLDRQGNELIAFTGDYPPCRVIRAAEHVRIKQGIRAADDQAQPLDDRD